MCLSYIYTRGRDPLARARKSANMVSANMVSKTLSYIILCPRHVLGRFICILPMLDEGAWRRREAVIIEADNDNYSRIAINSEAVISESSINCRSSCGRLRTVLTI